MGLINFDGKVSFFLNRGAVSPMMFRKTSASMPKFPEISQIPPRGEDVGKSVGIGFLLTRGRSAARLDSPFEISMFDISLDLD